VSPLGRRRREEPRRGTPSDLLVVGLGNPGAQYRGTRHNLGVEVVEALAARHDGRLRKGKELALVDEVRIDAHRVALAWPQTFMNNSGDSVRLLVSRYGIEDPSRLVVVHDELDLPVGRLKLKLGGGLAGNNGLRSIKAHLGTDEFARVRIGIGKPSSSRQGADHVLRPPAKAERTELDIVVQEAADAVEMILSDGFDAAMNRYNAAPPAS
jgi:PTH1 family peptidyl-tRNA hydrolase